MKRIVFCDFDGTITAVETFVAMLKRFTPEIAAQVMPELYAKRMTLREGVRRMLESIPSSQYAELVEFTRSQPIREGFAEFLTFMESQNITFVVISGGLQGMVEAVLEPYLDRVHAIHAIEIDASSGPFLKPFSPYEAGTEMVAKADIMATYHADQTIAIGDSITDWNMALAADLVFARSPLTTFLDEKGKPYLEWTDFFEVRDRLAEWIKDQKNEG